MKGLNKALVFAKKEKDKYMHSMYSAYASKAITKMQSSYLQRKREKKNIMYIYTKRGGYAHEYESGQRPST